MPESLIWVQCDLHGYRIGMGPYKDFKSYKEISPVWEAAGRCPIRFQESGMTCDVIDDGQEIGHAVPVEGFKSNSEFRKCMRAHWCKIAGIKLGKK